jgi:pilus assembly protein FimV
MKRTLLSTLVITSTLGLSSNVFALGMGELELKSTLNQPLQAEIELTNIDDLTEWEIKPSLASDGDFDRAGVEKIFFLSDIDFEVKGSRIILSSDKSVTEPFLNFLVQVNWPSGRVLREYTLLLDPPVFDEQIQPLSAFDVPQRVESQQVVAAETQSVNRWESEAAAPGTYKVQPNDTLWEIAINTRPSRQVSPQQMMLAIQDGNPGAFINGNINRLKTHQVLRIPTQQQMAARNDSQAVNEVLRQNRELQAAGAQIDATANAAQTNKAEQLTDGGELKLLSKQNEVSDSAGASGDVESGIAGSGREEGLQNDLAIALETLDTSKLENDDLKTRLASLEEQIATLQRLVSLKDDQLASIQTLGLQDEALAEVDALATENVITEDAVSEDVVSENALGEQDPAIIDLSEEQVTDTLAEDSSTNEAADFNYAKDIKGDSAEIEQAVPAIDPVLAADQIQQQTENRYKPKGFIAQVMAKPEYMAGIAGGFALLLGLIGFAIKKRRGAKEGEIEDPELAGFDENFEFGEGELDASSLDDFDFDEHDQAGADGELTDDLLEGIGSTPEEQDDELEQADTVAQTADIIGEAEIYIAYGRFDQAADLLKNSIELEPSRIDLRMKLLEVYLETDDASSFAEAELELNAIGDLEANEKAVVMRNRLSSPISGGEAPVVADLMAEHDVELGIGMEDLADADDEFAGGIDFEAALDLTGAEDVSSSEMDDFASSLDALDAEDANLGFEQEELEGLDFDLTSGDDVEEEIPTLDDLSDSLSDDLDELALDDIPMLEDDSDEVPVLEEFSELEEVPILEEVPTLDEVSELDDVPTLEEVPVLDEVSDLEGVPSLDLDAELESLNEDLGLDLPEAPVSDVVIDLAAMADDDSSIDVADLESLLDSDESVEGLPELDFDLAETGFEGDDLGDDLQTLEAELDDLTSEAPEREVAAEEDVVAEESVVAEENVTAEEESLDFEASSEFDLNELEDLPDFTVETAEADVAQEDAGEAGQEIDLEQLAAADDEFDFLAGTDECATKLDLARAYLDMEDNEGAKELLQEVVAEGSDQQKQDARALMDSIG